MTRIADIRARAKVATPGPWTSRKYNIGGPQGMVVPDPGTHEDGDGMKWDDKQFIAHAREDIPYLLDLVERAVVLIQRVVDGIRVDDTREEQQWLCDVEVMR